jgi:hypothetical protein
VVAGLFCFLLPDLDLGWPLVMLALVLIRLSLALLRHPGRDQCRLLVTPEPVPIHALRPRPFPR